MEVDGTDEGSHRIKSSRSRGRRRPKEGMGDMPRDEDAFHTHINPSQRKIWQRNSPVLFLHVNMQLKREAINSVVLTKVPLVVLALVFKRDAGIKTKERWEKGIGVVHC